MKKHFLHENIGLSHKGCFVYIYITAVTPDGQACGGEISTNPWGYEHIPYDRLDMSLPRKMSEEILQASGIVKTIDLEII